MRNIFLWSAFGLLVTIPSFSSHLRGGEIHVERLSCESLIFKITIVAYINYSDTNVQFGGEDATLSFGDGYSVNVPETPYEILDSDNGVARVVVSYQHTYANLQDYTITYSEPNRNDGVVNFSNSVTTPFFLETRIVSSPMLCNSSPKLLVSPIDRACQGVAFFHALGAVDEDGDSLSYEIVTPRQSLDTDVLDYRLPNAEKFYSSTGTDYNKANENQDGPPTFVIDHALGILIWDAPGQIGEYTTSIKIIEWRWMSQDSTWQRLGYVVRDMQIIVEDCQNQRPFLETIDDLCVIAGAKIDFVIRGFDPNQDPVMIEIFSELSFGEPGMPFIAPETPVFQSTLPPNDTAQIKFVWQTSCEHSRSRPYQLILKISDRPPSGPKLTRFYSVLIKVIPPAPAYEYIDVNPVDKTVSLRWKESECENATAYQIWRRTSLYSYEQPECNNGMPYFLRYRLLAEVPSSQLTYVDENLSMGAQYCYRIVALVGPTNMPSRISIDTCFIPRPAEAPVITNVSVMETATTLGAIDVRWTQPFDIDPLQYPSPYQYKVFRQRIDEAAQPFEPASEILSDTFFLDETLNSQTDAYRYFVELYVPSRTSNPVDSSSIAASVFLTSKPLLNAIELRWESNEAPWSNHVQDYPYHLVFRGESQNGDFKLIDSVDVNEHDLFYIDSGQYQSQALAGSYYYYKVLTRGSYGNPKIISPLENFSQIARGQVLDTVPPCAPFLSLITIPCENYSCDPNSYYNKLTWQLPQSCADDVVDYEVFLKTDSASLLIATINAEDFMHDNLSALEKCYQVISVDAAGNRSEVSNTVCNVNCTDFNLSNVITPELKDGKNDFLTYYDLVGDECPRSVKAVQIKIMSRWGSVVFTNRFTSDQHIFWDGLDQKGKKVASGVYYYSVKVTFETAEPSQQSKEVDGWVHVLR